ncbi:MAG: hypothetical protein A3E37_04430 [Candidatus Andersenbacteria bacterium RIFCSPHIGHO2_12_FULL_46_9]|nr:MAG: hypothetical protein A3B76_00510 [Candidatus Andersenbacteria bacterium RIFCSPHIGHO2_02_FULL_46_16]OGY36102.1 MAG: hypothetical protein A3E37_04430 [Candidatus Andersenbacteria bacterium RIFCSPHIGHO2_12_FULL_46_9]OGY36622.1 MAG: hypothetical protein A3I08_01180 [Candidatus Andersenbacteria bacterium RIFCSPLOWO2_02_FULL_46_11]
MQLTFLGNNTPPPGNNLLLYQSHLIATIISRGVSRGWRHPGPPTARTFTSTGWVQASDRTRGMLQGIKYVWYNFVSLDK